MKFIDLRIESEFIPNDNNVLVESPLGIIASVNIANITMLYNDAHGDHIIELGCQGRERILKISKISMDRLERTLHVEGMNIS